MGISPPNGRAIIREHVHRPFTGDVIAIGRQTFLFSPTEAVQILRDEGVAVPADLDPKTVPLDTDTKFVASGEYIRDDALFQLMGVPKIKSLDVTDYEGADIIHDLNQPLPVHLENTADVLIDGSTLDNVFNPAEALRSLSKMLRPGGRLISFNLGSNHLNPYTVFTPGWFFDYFVVNDYADVRVYANLMSSDGGLMTLVLDPSRIDEHTANIWNIQTPHAMAICVVAEKGLRSTSDRLPTQLCYQTPNEKVDYLKTVRRLALVNDRPDHFDSTAELYVSCGPIYRGVKFLSNGPPPAPPIVAESESGNRITRALRSLVGRA